MYSRTTRYCPHIRIFTLRLAFVAATGAGALAQPSKSSSPDMQVRPIAPAALAAAITRRERLLVLDVRSPDEFAVSHLKGAIRLAAESNEDRDGFLARVGRKVAGTTVVFYCTSALRSGDFAQGVLHELLAREAKAVFVLKGGIIAWHNEGQPLVNRSTTTRYVHPFNEEMKQHMRRPELARMEPRAK